MTNFKIKNIIKASYNPRIHPDGEIESLMKSIEANGFIEAIVLNSNKERYGTMIGGHMRLKAVEKLLAKGIEIKNIEKDVEGDWTIPAMLVELSENQEKQANIALNRIGGKFDESKLYDLVVEMRDSPSISVTGLSEKEISAVLHWNDEVVEKKDINASICERCNELKLMVQGHSRRTSHALRITDKDFE